MQFPAGSAQHMKMRLLQAFRIYGPALPWLLLKKLVSPCIKAETIIVYRRPIQASATAEYRPSVAVEVIRIVDSTSTMFGNLCAKFPQRDFATRLQKAGNECYVAVRDGKLSGYAWVANSNLQIDEIAREYPLNPQEIFIYDCFVDSECRGAGIYPSMLCEVLKDYGVRSAKLQALIASSPVNQPSIRGIAKAGFNAFKRVHYIRWLGRQWWWERPA